MGEIHQAALEECCVRGESAIPRIWILCEEYHNFVSQKVPNDAKPHARRAMGIFDTVRREGRKFGLFTGFIATSFHDAGGAIASTSRLNTNTLIAFKTRDCDLQYVSSFIDPKCLEQLSEYEAYLCCPQGSYRFITRPPYSKVSHIPGELRGAVLGQKAFSQGDLTEDELRVLNAAWEHYTSARAYPNVACVMRAAAIRSKGKLEAVLHSLETKGYLRTEKEVNQRGSPRFVIPLARTGDGAVPSSDGTPDEI